MQFNKQYDFQEISNIPIYFVKTHNLALPIWGEFSKNIRNEKLELITFDYHTDTHIIVHNVRKKRKEIIHWKVII